MIESSRFTVASVRPSAVRFSRYLSIKSVDSLAAPHLAKRRPEIFLYDSLPDVTCRLFDVTLEDIVQEFTNQDFVRCSAGDLTSMFLCEELISQLDGIRLLSRFA